MPEVKNYIAVVTVSVELKEDKTVGGPWTVATYSVTRDAKATTHTSAPPESGGGASGAVDRALVAAVGAETMMRAAVREAERRRVQ